MKSTHRSEKLDQFLGFKVAITFFDDTTARGVLFWNKTCTEPLFLKRGCYYVLEKSGTYVGFRKTHVKDIRRIEED